MDNGSLGSAFARGTLWSVGLRWTLKLIGLISTIVLARLLSPGDFGIVAIASLCVSFFDLIFSMNSDAVVLRDANASKSLIDSAWTLKVLEGLGVAVAIALISPVAALFFHEPRLVPVLLALCGGIAISGFASYGPMLARKDLDFGLEVRLAVVSKVITFAITVGVAYWLRSYWALVIGTVAGYATGCALTYLFHNYRSSFTLSRVPEIWNFSQWLLLSNIGQFFTRKTDEFLVARMSTTSEMGLYSVASDLGQTVSLELSAPMNRALLPVLAQLSSSTQRMQGAVSKLLSAANILILPAGFGLAAVSERAVEVLLGAKWAPAAPLLAMFSIAWALRYMAGPYPVMLIVKGKSRVIGILTWAEAAVLIVLALALASRGVYGLAWARTIAAVAALLMWVGIGPSIGLDVKKFVEATWRPLCGALLMFGLLRVLPEEFWLPFSWADLLARILVGAFVYTAWIIGTWQMLKRPDGLEARVIALLGTMLADLRRRF